MSLSLDIFPFLSKLPYDHSPNPCRASLRSGRHLVGGVLEGTFDDREKVFAELRANRPISWHRPVKNGMFEDPNDQGFWAVVRHADLVEVTRRPGDFLSGKGITFESFPPEMLDAAQGFIAMDPPRHTKIRWLMARGLHPKQLVRIDEHIVANSKRIVDDIAAKGRDRFRHRHWPHWCR